MLPFIGKLSVAFSERFIDRPYHFARPFSFHYFDCRQIDLVSHRVMEYPIDDGLKLQKLYTENKAKFYRQYFKKTPIQQHFQNFKYYLRYLPMSRSRDLIFDELIKLFKARRWISFYALALPQVEGLFSEMCLTISPEQDLSQKSLTYKVNSVRPFYFLSTPYFDYYQYHIPIQRNKFAHIGHDEDFKLKSYDLLVDLSHLLQIFYELDNAFVKIKRLHIRRDGNNFVTIKDFANYFRLLNQLNPSQLKQINPEIDKFEQEFLIQDCSIDYTCFEIIQELPKIIPEFTEYINASFKMLHGNIEFEKMNQSQIEKLLEKPDNYQTMRDLFTFKNEEVEQIEDHYIFLSNYNKYLPSLQREVAVELENAKKKATTAIKRILNTNEFLKKNEQRKELL